MWIKICGNTRLQDCLAAAELGADAVGFVFAPGKRTVTATEVAAITRNLPPTLEKIGVFASLDAEEIAGAVRAAGLTGVQLHSDYSPQLVLEVRKRFLHDEQPWVVQVLSWNVDEPAEKQAPDFPWTIASVSGDDLADALLIDSRSSSGSGGTGRTFDWATVAAMLQGKTSLPVIVAGGLRPENVGEAVRVLRPWGVDVSSGVEAAPGVKDRAAMAQFIERARSA